MKIKLNLFFSLIFVMLFFSACIKDTDFNQTDDILVTPIVELDFLFYNLNSESFTDFGVNNLILSDTTNFNFLNDDFVVDNLIRAEFFFKYTNSLPVDFITEYKFLDENNNPHYEVIIPVGAGTVATALIVEHIENIEGDDIIALTNAEKVVVNIMASAPVDNLEGNLKLQSKTTYYLIIEQ